MINYFNFNGKDSRDFGIMVRDKSTYKKPERDKEFISVPGRSGDIIVDNGRYKNFDMSYGITLFSPEITNDTNENLDLAYASYDLKNWLSADDSYYRLFDSYDPFYFFEACLTGEIYFETFSTHIAKTELSFNCKPYRYRFDGENMISFEKTGVLVNPEIHNSLPYFKIYGNGDLTLHVNGQQCTIYGVSTYVEIDSDIMNTFKGVENWNGRFSGAYPELQVGKNSIAVSGDANLIQVIPRWRTI